MLKCFWYFSCIHLALGPNGLTAGYWRQTIAHYNKPGGLTLQALLPGT